MPSVLTRPYLIAIIVAAIGVLSAAMFFSILRQNDLVTKVPTSAKLSNVDALRIIEDDLKSKESDYRIVGIAVNSTIANNKLTYMPFDEFKMENLTLPLVFVHPNQTVIRILGNGEFQNMGKCNTGLSTYCGYLAPFNFDYKSRLVYGAELLVSSEADLKGAPIQYIIDATSGKILDSTFLRSGNGAH